MLLVIQKLVCEDRVALLANPYGRIFLLPDIRGCESAKQDKP
jgi:hypothetical protein